MYKMILKQLWNERKGGLVYLVGNARGLYLPVVRGGRLVRDVQTLLAALGL